MSVADPNKWRKYLKITAQKNYIKYKKLLRGLFVFIF